MALRHHVVGFLAFLLSCSIVQAQNLDELLKLYKQYDLPLPPADSVLCIQEHGDTRVVNGKRVQYRHLLFALEEPTSDKSVACLVGIHEWASSRGDRFTPVTPNVSLERETEPMSTETAGPSRLEIMMIA